MSVFDERMAEIAADRRGESWQARELEQLADSTAAVNAGTSNGGLWLLVVAGIALAPFTLGAGFLLSIVAAIKMSGGKHMILDAMPHAVDTAAPKAGCVRVLASLVSLVLAIAAVAFVLALVAFEMGVIG